MLYEDMRLCEVKRVGETERNDMRQHKERDKVKQIKAAELVSDVCNTRTLYA
jgi:hypothetical protein